MKTNSILYKIVVLAMVFGLVGVPVALAEGPNLNNESPLIFIAGHSNQSIIGKDVTTNAAAFKQGGPNLNNDSPLSFIADNTGTKSGEVAQSTAALWEDGQPEVIKVLYMNAVASERDRVPGPDTH